jgi:hypothetical protein
MKKTVYYIIILIFTSFVYGCFSNRIAGRMTLDEAKILLNTRVSQGGANVSPFTAKELMPLQPGRKWLYEYILLESDRGFMTFQTGHRPLLKEIKPIPGNESCFILNNSGDWHGNKLCVDEGGTKYANGDYYLVQKIEKGAMWEFHDLWDNPDSDKDVNFNSLSMYTSIGGEAKVPAGEFKGVVEVRTVYLNSFNRTVIQQFAPELGIVLTLISSDKPNGAKAYTIELLKSYRNNVETGFAETFNAGIDLNDDGKAELFIRRDEKRSVYEADLNGDGVVDFREDLPSIKAED